MSGVTRPGGWISALLGCMILLCSTAASGQDFKIIKVDSGGFPAVKMSVIYSGKSRFDQNDLKIRQENQDVLYTIRESTPGSAPEKGRAVYFLVEASGNTSGKIISDLKEGIKGAMDNLEPEDYVNVGFFGSIEVDSLGLQQVKEKFTQNQESIRSAVASRIKPITDTARRSDLYKNIHEALEYIGQQPGLPKNMLFIVLSTARNNSNSPVTSGDCIARSKELGIPVFSITYLSSDSAYSAERMIRISNKTGGKNTICRSQVEIINSITDFLSMPMPQSAKDAAYEIDFNIITGTEPVQAKIEIIFQNTRQFLTVSDPNITNIIPEDYKKYLWISIGILGLIVVIMVLINLFSRKSKKTNQPETDEIIDDQKISRREGGFAGIDPAGRQVQSEVIPEVKKPTMPETLNAPSGPIVLVSLNGRTATFPLTQAETTLGRHDSNDIPLAEQTVTGHHAMIRLDNKVITIEDLGSTNGTFVNGERIRSKVIKHGDRIRLGQVELTLKE